MKGVHVRSCLCVLLSPGFAHPYLIGTSELLIIVMSYMFIHLNYITLDTATLGHITDDSTKISSFTFISLHGTFECLDVVPLNALACDSAPHIEGCP